MSIINEETSDTMRDKIAEKEITVDSITEDQLNSLHKYLTISLAQSDCFKGTYRMEGKTGSKFMTCSAHYFDGREAVSFNRDGFIGFAGWADSNNIKPIYKGVSDWLDSL